MFYEGRQIGSYTLIRKLGKGGFGEVWLAEKRSQFVTKKVAVKLPLDEQVNLDAIRQEAELWEQASGHPNVLPIIDADIIDSQVVIVSEYASGGSLADRIKQEGKLSVKQAVEMTIGILNGLEFLHSRRIIHRDIKPQNILLQGNTPRLADFGISRAMNTTVVSSAVIGTDAYMSPESFDGKRTVQTDIWSVGVVLYALLADRLPFPQEHPSERMFAILTKEFEPLPTEVPQNLQKIVYRALAKQPENRYQTTTEMRDELQKVLIGIAHPTFAPTEVFQIRTENLPTIPAVEEVSETVEAENETVLAPQNFNVPAPTEPAFSHEESVVTHFKQAPPTNEAAISPVTDADDPPAAQFQMFDAQTNDSQKSSAPSLKAAQKQTNLAYAIGGMLVIFAIVATVIYVARKTGSPTVLKSENSSNSSAPLSNASPTGNASSGSTANQSVPSPLAGKTIPRRFKRGDKYGIFDVVTGRILVEPKFQSVGSTSEGLAIVTLDGKCGFIDSSGAIVIQPKYEPQYYDSPWCESQFSEGMAAVLVGSRYGFIDKTGALVVPAQFKEADAFSEGLACVKLNGKYGYIDKTGKMVIPNKFITASSFSEGLARVCNNSKCGFIDRTGNIAIPLEYDGVTYFSDGLAVFYTGELFKEKHGYLDKSGNVVIQTQYASAGPFVDGRAIVKLTSYSAPIFIDKTGSEVKLPNGLTSYKEIERFNEDLALVKDYLDKFGFIDRTGKVVIQPKFDKASSFSDGIANVKLGERVFYIDKNGTEYPEP